MSPDKHLVARSISELAIIAKRHSKDREALACEGDDVLRQLLFDLGYFEVLEQYDKTMGA